MLLVCQEVSLFTSSTSLIPLQDISDGCVDSYRLELNGSSSNSSNSSMSSTNEISADIQAGVYRLSIYTRLADGYNMLSWSQIYTTRPGEFVTMRTLLIC